MKTVSLKELSDVEGEVSIHSGVCSLASGETIDLRALVASLGDIRQKVEPVPFVPFVDRLPRTWGGVKESCAKCGRTVASENAIYDLGEGAEDGSEFTYCSEDCRDRH
jgi:hypothetical protein